ncbi:MAG: DUF1289 domain-containing protein [Rhodobacteraceae bacterium]|nr:DUF1289 domain-containing protein [Paracoccaceae bacterium]
MTDAPVWRRDEIESPCVQICVIHPVTKLCTGCARSLEEIGAWSRLSPETRKEIIAELPSREPAPKTRRGGRAARMARASGQDS